jgi:hypothetical protein
MSRRPRRLSWLESELLALAGAKFTGRVTVVMNQGGAVVLRVTPHASDQDDTRWREYHAERRTKTA